MGIGDPEDLTGAVVLLCGEAGRFITGTDIKIDGEFRGLPWMQMWRLMVACRGLYNLLSWTFKRTEPCPPEFGSDCLGKITKRPWSSQPHIFRE